MNHNSFLPWDDVRIVATIIAIDNNLLLLSTLQRYMGVSYHQKVQYLQKRAAGVSRSLHILVSILKMIELTQLTYLK